MKGGVVLDIATTFGVIGGVFFVMGGGSWKASTWAISSSPSSSSSRNLR